MSDTATAQDNTAGLANGTQTVGENLAPMSLTGDTPAPAEQTQQQATAPAQDTPVTQEAPKAEDANALSPDVKPAQDESALAPGQTAETKSDASDTESPTEGAPESYEDFDLNKELYDESAQTEFKELAKSLNMSQQDAANGAKFGAALLEKLAQEDREAQAKAKAEADAKVREQVAKWQQDPQYLDKEMLAAKAAKHLGILDHIRANGLNNDLVLLGALSEVGKLVSEAKALTAGSTSSGSEENPYVNSPELVN
jgi:hypothetical protein